MSQIGREKGSGGSERPPSLRNPIRPRAGGAGTHLQPIPRKCGWLHDEQSCCTASNSPRLLGVLRGAASPRFLEEQQEQLGDPVGAGAALRYTPQQLWLHCSSRRSRNRAGAARSVRSSSASPFSSQVPFGLLPPPPLKVSSRVLAAVLHLI